MTMLTDPEGLNHRLNDYPQLTHPADVAFFDDLISRIQSMVEEQDGDDLQLPGATEPFAWRRAFAVYQKRLRRRNEPAPVSVVQQAEAHAALERSWGFYIEDRTAFLAIANRGEITQDAAVYLGLVEGDLDEPIVPVNINNRYGGSRHPDWRERAGRLSNALARWRNMSAHEKNSIPVVMKSRRADAALWEMKSINDELRRRLERLEAVVFPVQQDTAA